MIDFNVVVLPAPLRPRIAAMGPEETGRMLRLVHDLPRDIAILIIEHDMDMVFANADRITVLNYGEVLLEGTAEDVRRSDIVRETYLGGGGV